MRFSPVLMLLALGAVGASVVAEEPPRLLHGRVFRIDEQSERSPAAEVEVRSQAGDSVRSGPDGSFRLPLPPVFQAGERLAVEVEDAGWIVGRPVDGEIVIPHVLAREVVEVELHREGSELFLSDERLEKLLVDSAELSIEPVARSRVRPGFSLDFHLRRWSEQHGRSTVEVRAKVESWLRRLAADGDAYRLGLAGFARGDLETAARRFRAAAEETAGQLDRRRQSGAVTEEEADRLRLEMVRKYRLEGAARLDADDLAGALAAYETALAHLSRQRAPQLWADTRYAMGLAVLGIGIDVRLEDAELRVRRLSAARAAFQDALEVFDRKVFPRHWAAAQTGLGRALSHLVNHSPEPEETVREAIRAFDLAAGVRTRQKAPFLWAATRFELAMPLTMLAGTTPGPDGAELLARAIEIYRQVSEVRTAAETPDLWVTAQSNAAYLLGELAGRSLGPERALYFEEMAKTCREVLGSEVEIHPYSRLLLYEHLADATTLRAFDAGRDAPFFFAEASEARRQALALVDRETRLADWVQKAFQLGAVLLKLAKTTEDEERREAALAEADGVLEQAVAGAELVPELTDTVPKASLAEVRWLRDEPAEAVRLLREVLAADPEYREGHLMLWSWAQDYLFDFGLAYRTITGWLERHPEDTLARVALTQNLLTTGRFEACLENIEILRGQGAVGAGDVAYLLAFEVAARRLLGRPPEELTPRVYRLASSVEDLPPGYTTGWQTRSVSYFLSHDEVAAPHRAWLLRLFETLRLTDRGAVVEGLWRLAEAVSSPRA